ncbi:MAG: hypothetical protein CM15mV70_620 [Caudoviricetes sp.]|nr:MAG: hypothetical protein CM15mV70_620 [Caudoviricetes sp.]
MAKSLDHVLQPDGTYKWEEVELVHSTAPVEPVVEPEVCPAPEPKATKKKVTKKKTTSPLSEEKLNLMAIEEKVIQPDSVTPAEQPVADTPSQPQAPDLSSVKAEYEAKLAAARKEAAEAEEKFKGIKGKLDDVYKQKEEKRTKDLEEQGQWKTLWEEANKTAQEKEQQIIAYLNSLKR